jgi:hypothetical protein
MIEEQKNDHDSVQELLTRFHSARYNSINITKCLQILLLMTIGVVWATFYVIVY